MSALVKCVIRHESNAIEDGTSCAFYVPLPLQQGSVEKMFPFEGTFQFRMKVNGKSLGLHTNDDVWLDMNKKDFFRDSTKFLRIDEFNGENVMNVQATLLSSMTTVNLSENDHNTVSEDAVYLESVGNNMSLDNKERLSRLPVNIHNSQNAREKGALSGITTSASKLLKFGTATLSTIGESVGRDAGSIWGSMTYGVTSMLGISGSSPSIPENAAINLKNISEIMSQVVSEKLLFTLWNAMKLDQIIDSTYTTSINGTSKYSRKTQDWKIMGWQKDDPVLDLKSSGTLAIECMSHFARNYPEAVNDMLGT